MYRNIWMCPINHVDFKILWTSKQIRWYKRINTMKLKMFIFCGFNFLIFSNNRRFLYRWVVKILWMICQGSVYLRNKQRRPNLSLKVGCLCWSFFFLGGGGCGGSKLLQKINEMYDMSGFSLFEEQAAAAIPQPKSRLPLLIFFFEGGGFLNY